MYKQYQEILQMDGKKTPKTCKCLENVQVNFLAPFVK